MHLDLDAFFVEVTRLHNPELRDVELLVVGGRRQSRGVVQSASYGARAFGVRSGMPIAEAVRRCPDATFVPGEFNRYRESSRQVRQVLERLAPAVVMTGLDEVDELSRHLYVRYSDSAAEHRERVAAMRHVRFEFEVPTGEIGLMREVQRFPFVPADPAVRERITRAWIGLKVIRAHALRTLADRDPTGGSASAAKLLWANWHRDLGEPRSSRPRVDSPLRRRAARGRSRRRARLGGGGNAVGLAPVDGSGRGGAAAGG